MNPPPALGWRAGASTAARAGEGILQRLRRDRPEELRRDQAGLALVAPELADPELADQVLVGREPAGQQRAAQALAARVPVPALEATKPRRDRAMRPPRAQPRRLRRTGVRSPQRRGRSMGARLQAPPPAVVAPVPRRRARGKGQPPPRGMDQDRGRALQATDLVRARALEATVLVREVRPRASIRVEIEDVGIIGQSLTG